MAIQTIAAVAFGGAFGATARYMVSSVALKVLGGAFPYGTLMVNILGSFLLGVLVETVALKIQLPKEVQSLISTGFLGAFTTFSTFSLDAVTLFERQAYGACAVYVVSSLALSIAALVVGLLVVRVAVA